MTTAVEASRFSTTPPGRPVYSTEINQSAWLEVKKYYSPMAKLAGYLNGGCVFVNIAKSIACSTHAQRDRVYG